jgi:hypothetical protein
MTRGRSPIQALNEADPIAEKRGTVQHYRREPGMICDFTIACPACFAHVRIKRMRRLRTTLEELERHTSNEIAALRTIASSPAISRELWICSPKCAWRFFRICDASIVELGRDGLPLVNGPTASSSVAAIPVRRADPDSK